MRNRSKEFLALFLLTVLFIKVCLIPVMYVDFELRREYIISKLCVNRNRPAMHCDGKCYLAKRLAALDEQDKRQAERQVLPAKLLSYVVTPRLTYHFSGAHIALADIPTLHFVYLSPALPGVVIDDIFRPPIS